MPTYRVVACGMADLECVSGVDLRRLWLWASSPAGAPGSAYPPEVMMSSRRKGKDSLPDLTLQARIDAATAYEEFFVPALFQEWTPRVVAAAQLQPGQRVLDVACGTGILAREAASCVGAAGAVVGLDPNPGMLTVARRPAHPLDSSAAISSMALDD